MDEFDYGIFTLRIEEQDHSKRTVVRVHFKDDDDCITEFEFRYNIGKKGEGIPVSRSFVIARSKELIRRGMSMVLNNGFAEKEHSHYIS